MRRKLLRRVELYLGRSGTSPTRFGLEAVRDPKLVFELRRGRAIRPLMEARLLGYLDRAEKALEGAPCRRRR